MNGALLNPPITLISDDIFNQRAILITTAYKPHPELVEPRAISLVRDRVAHLLTEEPLCRALSYAAREPLTGDLGVSEEARATLYVDKVFISPKIISA
jgi:hypothetical protein